MLETCGSRSSIDEGILIARVKAGESELFRQLIDPYARKMYVLAYSVLRNQHDAEDVVQESTLKAFMRLDQLRSSAAFKCWLLQITINEARMRRRHARLYPCISIDDDPEQSWGESSVLPELVDGRENPVQAMERTEMAAAIDRAWNDLPRKYRNVLQLRCAEDLNLSEIGGALKLGIPAVKTRLHRARLHLRKRLVPVVSADRNYRAA